MTEHRDINCCGCGGIVSARLTDGQEIYPHRRDLFEVPFWRCDACGGFVGTHYKDQRRGQDPLRPKGTIPTPELRRVRSELHKRIDPLWREGPWTRKGVYGAISDEIGREFHIGEISSMQDAQDVDLAIEALKEREPA